VTWEDKFFIQKHPWIIKCWGKHLFEGEGGMLRYIYPLITSILLYQCCSYCLARPFNDRLDHLIIIVPFIFYIYQGDVILKSLSTCSFLIF
jgi:hypothetical protein